MDMNKLLADLNSIEKGTYEGPATQEKNEMKTILESLKAVNEGPMDMAPSMAAPSMPEPEKVTMNINMNAQGTDAIADLIKLMGGETGHTDIASHNVDTGDSEMAKLKAIMAPKDEPTEEEYANEPDEEYGDTQMMTKDLAGGLNREKPKKAIRVKDPAVESVKDQLWKALEEKKNGICPDCGNPSWKTLPEEKQKGVDGKACWKGYKRMGTKKKGGKTVDNCVKM
jgi:hypothetical protein